MAQLSALSLSKIAIPTISFVFIVTHHVLFEGVEELDNVSSSADVDQQKLGELVVRQLAFGQQPPAQDQQQQQHLFQRLDPLLGPQPEGDADL